MIHSVKINDNLPAGKRLKNELRRHPKAVVFENPALSSAAPEGYNNSEEFWKDMDKKIDNLCKEHGLLQ